MSRSEVQKQIRLKPPVYGVQCSVRRLHRGYNSTGRLERFHDAEEGANDPDWALKVWELLGTINPYLVQGHSVLDKQSNATVEVTNIALKDKVLL